MLSTLHWALLYLLPLQNLLELVRRNEACYMSAQIYPIYSVGRQLLQTGICKKDTQEQTYCSKVLLNLIKGSSGRNWDKSNRIHQPGGDIFTCQVQRATRVTMERHIQHYGSAASYQCRIRSRIGLTSTLKSQMIQLNYWSPSKNSHWVMMRIDLKWML